MTTPPIPIWRQSDNFSRIAHQRMVDAHNARRLNLSNAPPVPRVWTEIGFIVPEGPNDENGEPREDFTDARYWVRLADCTTVDPEEIEEFDPILFEGRPEVTGQPHIIPVTNIAELPENGIDGRGSHGLPMGKHVRVWAIQRRQPSGSLVTVFEMEVEPRLVTIRIQGNRTRGGCYQAFVCRQIGDGGSDGAFDTTEESQVHGALLQVTEEEVTAVNLNEHGGDPVTHYLTDAGNDFQKHFHGRFAAAVDEEDRRVVTFNGFWQKVCTPTPTPTPAP